MMIKKWIFLFSLPLATSLIVHAESQGNPAASQADSQSFLIEKLERVNSNLSAQDPSKIAVTLRLADLLAERARLASMKDLDSGCTICTAGEQDRKKALRLYQEVLAKTPEAQKGRVLVQMGHLFEMLGDEKEALRFYQETAGSTNQASAKAEAHLSIAEIHFKRNRFAEAKSFYTLVLNEKSANSRGLAAYRVAWCDLNLRDLNAGIEQLKMILKNPELQSKSAVAGGQSDRQFVEEVSRDLATWMAKTSEPSKQMEELGKLSPESTREGNLITLAQELERTGNKSEALAAWKIVQAQSTKPEVRLEAQVRITPQSFDEKQTDVSLKNLEMAIGQWQDLKGCGKTDCSELEKILRGFIVNWNQTEKKAPSENLQKAYELYAQLFPQDGEMAQWGAQVAKERQDWKRSDVLMGLAVEAFAKDSEKLESMLLIRLENAELSKIPELWSQAATQYLQRSPKQTKSYEVKYQQARKLYDAGDYKSAQESLRVIAYEKAAPKELRVQAAHLSLDSINLLKEEGKMASEAQGFAQLFSASGEGKEFAEIHHKAVMNDVARVSAADPEVAWKNLIAEESAQMTPEDRKLYLKNKILLAEKTKRFDVVGATLEDYLLLPGLTAEEKEFAHSKKAWLAELRLDFSTAMKATQNLATTLKPEQKALKLAIFADLSGVDSQSFYQQYMGLSKDEDIKRAIALQMIRKAKSPQAEMEKYSALLAKDPEVLAGLYAEFYAKAQDEKILKKARADHRIEKTVWGQSLARAEILGEIAPLRNKLPTMKVESKTQRAMATSMKARAQELEKLEKIAGRAIQNGDWTTQLVSLDLLAKESERFYQEILSLPVPAGLNPDEESQYLNLLGQQASPFQTRAQSAKAKVEEFWKTANWKESLQSSLKNAGVYKALLENEIESLRLAASGENLQALESLKAEANRQIATEASSRPNREVIEAAKNEVRQNPFDQAKIQKLLEIEQQSGDFAMVRYLEERLRGNQR